MALIKDEDRHFLVLGAPEDPKNLTSYIQLLKDYNVTHLIRACEPTYDTKTITDSGIAVVEMVFSDGGCPPTELAVKWLQFVSELNASGKKGNIAVHCQQGLGRAPLLVALALIENGMDNLMAINIIREKMKSALNTVQLHYVLRYKKLSKGGEVCCIV